jgi:hypothetical protein
VAELLKEAKYTITEFTMTHRKKLSEFAGLEVELPKIELSEPTVDIASNELQQDTHDVNADDEGAMMKADLYKLAKYSVKLFKKIEDEDQFESWVQAKITKAADYISSVYHYLEYEMKFSEYGDKIENSDMYSESEKRQMKNALMEAKKSLAALKINQADKLNPLSEARRSSSKPEVNFTKDDLTSLQNIADLNTLKTRALDLITTPSKHPVTPDLVNYSKNALENCKTPAAVIIFMYNMLLGGEGLAVIGTRHGMDASHYRKSRGGLKDPGEFKEGFNEVCSACGGAGHVEKKIPEATRVKVEKYNRQAKAFSAASKRLDKNKNGIPDDMESDAGGEEFTATKKAAPKKSSPFDKEESKPKKSAPKKSSDNEDDCDSDSEKPDSKKSAPKKDSGNPFAKKSAPKKEKSEEGDSKTESMFGGSVYGESVTPVKKTSGVADKKGGNLFAKKDDAKKDGGKEFGKALDKARADVKESAKEKAKKDYDKDGKIETGKEEHKGSVDNAIKSSKEKECMNESVELTRLREITSRVIR